MARPHGANNPHDDHYAEPQLEIPTYDPRNVQHASQGHYPQGQYPHGHYPQAQHPGAAQPAPAYGEAGYADVYAQQQAAAQQQAYAQQQAAAQQQAYAQQQQAYAEQQAYAQQQAAAQQQAYAEQQAAYEQQQAYAQQQAAAQRQAAAAQQQAYAQQGYASGSAHAQAGYDPAGYGQTSYGQTGYGQTGYGQTGYAGQAPAEYAPQHGYADAGQHPASHPHAGTAQPELRGPAFDQWPQHDPRGYDLGQYGRGGATAAATGYGGDAGGYGADGTATLSHAGGHAGHGYGNNGFAERGYAQHGYAEQGPAGQAYAPPQGGGQPGGHGTLTVDPNQPSAGEEGYDDEDYEDDVDEQPSGRGRTMMIVGALIGAIAIGGAMAYGYKSLVGGGSSGNAPVIKADQRPSKTQPTDQGGKKFANTDSKIMGRLGDNGAGEAADANGSRVRTVSTLTVGRDGSIAAPPPATPAPSAAASGSVIPGLRIDGAAPPSPQPTVTVLGQSPAQTAPSPLPKVIARAEPAAPSGASQGLAATTRLQQEASVPVGSLPPAAAPPASRSLAPPASVTNGRQPELPVRAPAAPAIQAQPPVVRAPAKTAAVDGPDAAQPPRVTSTGYVAVLSSQKSRMDALKAFADLQQQFPNVLASKIPDVQEANLADRGLGTMYRVVVGPPASRQAATRVCAEMKQAGYQGCWVTGY